jgi:uncharacterized membrane protein
MSLYLAIKYLHVVSSIALVGIGFGSAYYMFFANRSDSTAAQAVVARLVTRADAWFTTPAVVVQPISGLWLAHSAGWPLTTPWIAVSLLLFALAGICWIPVLWLQLRMAAISAEANRSGSALPDVYWRYAKRWELLGYPAFVAMLIVLFLMVVKPALSV